MIPLRGAGIDGEDLAGLRSPPQPPPPPLVAVGASHERQVTAVVSGRQFAACGTRRRAVPASGHRQPCRVRGPHPRRGAAGHRFGGSVVGAWGAHRRSPHSSAAGPRHVGAPPSRVQSCRVWQAARVPGGRHARECQCVDRVAQVTLPSRVGVKPQQVVKASTISRPRPPGLSSSLGPTSRGRCDA